MTHKQQFLAMLTAAGLEFDEDLDEDGSSTVTVGQPQAERAARYLWFRAVLKFRADGNLVAIRGFG